MSKKWRTQTHTPTVNYHVITWGGSIRRLLVVKSHRSLLFTVLHHGAYANDFQMVLRYWWIFLHSMLKTAWIKEKPKQRGETLNNSHSLKILWSSRPVHTDEYGKAKKSHSSLFQRRCYKKIEAMLCLFFLFPYFLPFIPDQTYKMS